MFFDRARIYVSAGNGGDGVVAFRREKYVPRGGPSGGNGGRGGNVIFFVDPGMNTLYHLQHNIHQRAERGGHGSGANKYGAAAPDLRIPVPAGTLVRNADTGAVLADLIQPGQEAVIARGGRGGRGNNAFKTARNTAPQVAEKGEPGEEHWLELELKLVADVGIIAWPIAAAVAASSPTASFLARWSGVCAAWPRRRPLLHARWTFSSLRGASPARSVAARWMCIPTTVRATS